MTSRSHGRTFTEMVAVLALVVIAAIVFGLAIDVVRSLLHVLELAVVAVGATCIGYGAGRAHGARHRSPREIDTDSRPGLPRH
jgi:hypothetical protein